MNIDDILSEKFGVDFEKVNKYLTKEMYSTAGEELVEYMEDVFEDREKAKNWYFSRIPALGYKRPYDFCKEGKNQEIKYELNRIDRGIF